MPSPSALATLIEIATRAADEAARRLGETIRQREEATQKLELLTRYRDDYALRGQADMAGGMSIAQFNNFQMFMAKLDQAIAGQRQIVAGAGQRADQARSAWMQCEQKKLSFATLNDRAARTEAHRETRRDQKQNDEYATRNAQPESSSH